MLSFNTNTYLLALAAIPSFLLVSHATPTRVHARASKDVLFRKGGPSLDDIAIKGDKSTRSEEATIFAQCLIALRKLNPNTITLWFDETIGEEDVKSTDTKVKPYYIGDESEVGKGLSEISINVDQAQKDAGDLSFGYTEDSAWWPYAMLSGARAAGWGKHNGKDIESSDLLAEQALTLLSGYDATVTPWGIWNDDWKALEKASQSPFILEIEKFNMTTNPELENVRWERWITVMEYSNSTGLIDYATSFYDGDGGITVKDFDFNKLTIRNIVWLTGRETFSGERAPLYVHSAGLAAPTGVIA